MSKIIVITGPTGVGKTDLSIKLAKALNGEVINADSMQVYREMDIGTNKIKDSEKCDVVHHLFDIKSLDEDYNVADYQRDGRLIIDDILKRDKTVIIVGGTGLYINALLYDYKFPEENSNQDVTLSIDEMIKELVQNNIDVDIDNPRRVKRYYQRYLHGSNDQPVSKLLYDAYFIGLTMDRDVLYERINNRVDRMIEKGLINEVKALYEKYPTSRALHTAIGYKEVINYLNSELELDEMTQLIKKHTRNYVKRQYTWFNNKMDLTWYKVNDLNIRKLIDDIKTTD